MLLLNLQITPDHRQLGAAAPLDETERTALDEYIIIADAGGLCSLHLVTGITRPRGRRLVHFGPQVPWPQGGMELRPLPSPEKIS